MGAKIFDGRAAAAEIEERLAQVVAGMDKKPKLVSIVVGDDKASHLYVDLKGEAAKRVGIDFEKVEYKNIDGLIDRIEDLNKDRSVAGIMVQMPLPDIVRHKTMEVVSAIAPEKDVDGLTGKSKFLPATVKAVLKILDDRCQVSDKKIVVVGRSMVVGRPLAQELMRRGTEVTVAHSQTADLGEVTRGAEILISATGKPGLITADMVKSGAVVIDVGEPKGYVAEDVYKVASFITPVPGGVGPMTVACLLENVMEAVEA